MTAWRSNGWTTVGIVVESLDAAISFFAERGLELFIGLAEQIG
jgi:hypothetical protein